MSKVQTWILSESGLHSDQFLYHVSPKYYISSEWSYQLLFCAKGKFSNDRIDVWHVLLGTTERIISPTPTVPSVLSVATSPTKSRVSVLIARGSIKMKKRSSFVCLAIQGNILLQSAVQNTTHANRDDTNQEWEMLTV